MKRMMKKLSPSIVAGTLMLSTVASMFSGCGNSSELGEVIAFVGSTESGENKTENEEIWQGITQFAESTDRKAVSYDPGTASVADAELTMKQAIEDGADVIVCTGDVMEYAVYDVQKIEKHTQFVLIDGVPVENKEDGEERIRGNTCSVIFSREVAGFLAGYSAVKDGYRSLGFFGSSRSDDIVRYGSGFIQGANQAAGELKLKKDEVLLEYKYMTSNAISPSQVADIAAWFDGGCQVISVAGRGAELVADQGAERSNGKIITDYMANDEKPEILTAAGINYATAASTALKMLADGEMEGGQINELGVADNCVYLKMDGSQFASFTAGDYEDILSKLQSGEIVVSSKDVTTVSKDESKKGKKDKNDSEPEITNITISEKK